MSNTSATGGYLVPAATQPASATLTLEQFIQTMIVGISGFADSTLIRPKFQLRPPKQPDVTVNWIGYAIEEIKTKGYAWISQVQGDGKTYMNREEDLVIPLSFYGPNAADNYTIFRDGFQITQNLEALRKANMGFKEVTDGMRGPDLINEIWVDRYLCTLTLVRQVVRTYPILSFVSASGTVDTVIGQDDYSLSWQTPEAP